MARLSSRDWNKKQRDFEKENLRRAANTVKAEAREKQRSGYVSGAMETADTNAKIYRVAQMAARVQQQSRKGSKDYRTADRLYKSAVRSENRYRNSVNRALESRANSNRPSNVRPNTTGQSKTSFDGANNVISRTGSYRNDLMRLSQERDRKRYEDAEKQRENERKAYLYKYGDVEHMSYSELKNRISKLESEKAQRQTERNDNDANMMGAAGGGVSSIINGNQGISPARRETLDKLDKDADDKIAEYKKALPAAAIRDEEKKLSEDDKKAVMAVADQVRQHKHGFAAAMDPRVGIAENRLNEALKQPLNYLKKRGVDIDYLVDAYGAIMDNEDAERDARASKDFAKESVGNAILSSAATVMASPATMISGIGEDISHAIRNTFGDKPLPVNQKNRWLSNNTEAIRGGVSEEIENPVWNFIYNAGMSTGDSAMALLTGSAIGGALGAGTKIGTMATQLIMSAGAADSTYNEAIERGIDPMNALATAVTAGVAEWVTEKYSIDNLKSLATKQPKTFKDLVKNIGKQMVTEGSEEAASDVMNTIADNIINGKKSVFEQSVRSYLDRGLTEEQARKAAMMDWLGNTAYDAAAGAFSGALMGVGGQALSFKQVQDNFSSYGEMVHKTGDINKVIEYAKKFGDLSEEAEKLEKVKFTDKESVRAGRLADDLQNRIDERINEATNAVELTDTYNELSEDAPDIVKANIDDAVARKAEELRQSNDDETEQYVLSQISDEARSSLEEKMDSLSDKLEASKDSSQDVPREIKVHGNTEARLAASGERVHIDGFVNIGTDNVGIRIDGNDVVPIDSLVFDDPRVEGLYHAAASMDDEAEASAMVSGYNGRMDAATYFGDFEKAYNWGSIGYDFDDMYKRSPFSISKDVAYQAYALGHNAYDAALNEANNRSDAIRAGQISFMQGEGKVTDERRDAEDLKKGVYEHIDEKLAKKLGINIREVDQTHKDINEKINGFLDINNAEMVFSDAAQSDFGVRVHESMEFLDAVDPATYNSLMRYVLLYAMNKDSSTSNDYIYNTIMAYRDTYRGVEGNKTFADAAGEYLNDAISGVFFSKEGAKDFIEWLNGEDIKEGEKKGIIQTILDIIDKVVKALSEALERSNMTKAQRHAASVKLETQKEIRQMFFDAMDYGAKAYKGSAGESADQGKAASAKAFSVNAESKSEAPIMSEDGKTVTINNNKYAVLSKREYSNRDIKRNEKAIREELEKALMGLTGQSFTIKSSNQTIIIGSDFADEYAHSKDTAKASQPSKRVKLNLKDQIGTMIENAWGKKYDKNRSTKHNIDAKRGWNYYTVGVCTLDEDGNLSPYEGTLNIRLDKNGSDYLYDITDIKKASGSLQQNLDGNQPVALKGIISQSQKNASPKIRKSVIVTDMSTEELDSDYQAAVDSKDESRQAELVREAARRAGYDSPMLYHGTQSFGFTEFDLDKMDDERSIFTTDSKELASTYSGRLAVRRIESNIKKAREIYENGTKEEKLRFIQEHYGEKYRYANREDIRSSMFSERHQISELFNTLFENEIKDEELDDTFSKWVKSAEGQKFTRAIEKFAVWDTDPNFVSPEELTKSQETIEEVINSESVPSVVKKYLDTYGTYSIDRMTYYIASTVNEDISNYVRDDDTGGVHNISQLFFRKPLDNAIYRLYGKTDGMLEFDAHNQSWNRMFADASWEGTALSEHFGNNDFKTRNLAEFAKDSGYSGVIIKNVIDDGGRRYEKEAEKPQTIRIFFNPSDVKSADNITYDENGEVIPLSERFKSENPDIRYSLKVDTEGRELTPEQQEYFKDSKILDDNGRLRVVYHGTNNTEFNIFDSKYVGSASGDVGFFGKGFYFAFTEGEAAYYGSKRIIPVYLNITNPFDFEKELHSYNGEEAVYGYAPDAVSFMNFTEKFPEIAEGLTISVRRAGSDTIEEISLKEFADAFRDVIDNKKFEYRKRKNEYGNEETIVTADQKEIEYEYNGKAHTHIYYDFEERFNSDAPHLDVAYAYLSKCVYSYVDMYNFTKVILENSDDFTESLKKKGYDGTIQSKEGDEAVAFYPEQIKEISNKTPTKSSDIRYSLRVDSEGRELTEGQREFFKDSKVLDEDGNLKVVYHGSMNDFTVFDIEMARGTEDIEAFFFSGDREEAEGYGDENLKEYYLNITNPADYDTAYDVFFKYKGQTGAGRKAREELEAAGYDGVIAEDEDAPEYTEYLVFNPEQIKLISNEDPTENPDIRFSIDVDTKELIRENAQLKEMVKRLEHEFELTGGKEADPEKVKRVAKKFLKTFNSSYDLDTLADQIMNIYSYLHSENGDGEVALAKMSEAAKSILKEGGDKVEGEYKDLRDYLRTTGISLSEAQKEEAANIFGSYGAFRKAMFGKVKLTNNGADLERIWNADLKNLAPELFLSDVNALNMPAILADTVDAIQPRVTPYGTEDIEQGAYDVAMQIYAELAKVPPVETFADKQEKKYIEGMNKLAESYEGLLDAYRKEIDTLNNADIEAAKEQFEQEKKVRLAKNTSEMKAILEAKKQARNPKTLADYEKKFKALEQENQRLRFAKADEVAKIKAKYNAKRLSDIDRRKSTETKDKIRKLHDRMRRMIIKPTETAYVPKDLMAAAIEVCNIVDLGYAEGTKLRKALDEARRAFPNVDKEDGILASDFDPRIADEIDTLTELFDNKPDGWSIKDASLEELNRIYDAMNGIYECIRMSTKLIREEGEKDARRAGKKVIKELEESKGLNTWLGKLSDKVTSSFLNSYREFRKISGYNDNGEIMFMWKELNEGQKKMYRAQMEGQEVLQKAFGSKEMDNLLKRLNSPKDLVRVPLRFKSGNAPVMVTRGMRLSLIMHGMSAANYRHMSVGGIEIPVNMKLIDNKQKAYEHTRRVVGIDYTALKQMEMELSTEEKKLLEVMKKLFHEWSGEKINETSNELYGFERARVKDYFPISVDKDYVATDISSLKFDKTIEGAGFLKERIQSVKPIILENIMDTAERTIKATSLFNGLAVPVRNYNKIMNTTTYEVTEADEGDGEIWVPNTSVKKMLKDKWGLRAQQYLDDLVADLQQARNREYTWYDRLRGNYAGAVLTANASVIIKQTSAYPTVAGIVGWMPTVKAMFRGGKNNWMLSKADTDLINKWSSLYWYRNQGNNSRDLAEIRDMNSFVNKVPPVKFTKDLIQKVDIAMVGRFWYAAQYYVDKNFKNLEKGSDAYYKKVAEYFDRSIEETQSTNMVMENADIMRNPSGGMKMITMFMGQGLQNFGIVYDNLANMRAKAKMVKEGKATKAELKQARKDFANAVTSQLVSAAMFAGLAIVARGLLHRMNPYRDDKEEITAESIATKFADDMAENIAGSIPFGSLIYEGVMAATDVASGKGFTRTYGQQDIVLDAISTLETDTVKLAKAIKKVIDGEESAVWDALNQTIKDGSKLFGIPYENIWNLGEGFAKHVSDVASGEGFLSYSSDQKDPSVSVIGGYLNEAIENGDTYSQEKYAETLYELGKSDKEINSQIAKNIKGDEAIINAAAARNSGDIATYSQTVVDYKDKGYPEAAVVSAITSVINSMNKKPKQDVIIDTGKIKKENGSFMNSIKNTDAKVYDSGDLTAAVEDGNVRNINAIVNALLKEKTDKGLSKEDAVKELSKSMKSTLSRQYHQMYLGSSMAERSKIIDKLSKVKLDGKPLYDQEHFLRWNKEAEKSP